MNGESGWTSERDPEWGFRISYQGTEPSEEQAALIAGVTEAARELYALFRVNEPDWVPLEEALPDCALGEFMFMGHVPDFDGLLLYKHHLTRRYLNLRRESDGLIAPYRWTGRKYVPTTMQEAVDEVYRGYRAAVRAIEDFEDRADNRRVHG